MPKTKPRALGRYCSKACLPIETAACTDCKVSRGMLLICPKCSTELGERIKRSKAGLCWTCGTTLPAAVSR